MGVVRRVITPGDGSSFPQRGDFLTMHYSGVFASNGCEFDSSKKRGKPFRFKIGVGAVIRGWDEGVMQMSVGEKSVLDISSDFAYGEEGVADIIPPNADLRFEVELLKIN